MKMVLAISTTKMTRGIPSPCGSHRVIRAPCSTPPPPGLSSRYTMDSRESYMYCDIEERWIYANYKFCLEALRASSLCPSRPLATQVVWPRRFFYESCFLKSAILRSGTVTSTNIVNSDRSSCSDDVQLNTKLTSWIFTHPIEIFTHPCATGPQKILQIIQLLGHRVTPESATREWHQIVTLESDARVPECTYVPWTR